MQVQMLQYVIMNGILLVNHFLNGKKYKQDQFTPQTTAAIKYYQDAFEFKKRIKEDYRIRGVKDK